MFLAQRDHRPAPGAPEVPSVDAELPCSTAGTERGVSNWDELSEITEIPHDRAATSDATADHDIKVFERSNSNHSSQSAFSAGEDEHIPSSVRVASQAPSTTSVALEQTGTASLVTHMDGAAADGSIVQWGGFEAHTQFAV